MHTIIQMINHTNPLISTPDLDNELDCLTVLACLIVKYDIHNDITNTHLLIWLIYSSVSHHNWVYLVHLHSLHDEKRSNRAGYLVSFLDRQLEWGHCSVSIYINIFIAVFSKLPSMLIDLFSFSVFSLWPSNDRLISSLIDALYELCKFIHLTPQSF